MRSLALAALTAAALATSVARADVVDNLFMSYASGATFNGTLTLTNDFSSVVSLNGTLTGYDPGAYGFSNCCTDPISVAFPFNYAPYDGLGSNIFFTTVPDAGFNFLDFGYSFDSSGITLDPSAGYNDVNYVDPLVAAAVPEPGTLALLAVGLLGLAVTHRRWTVKASLR